VAGRVAGQRLGAAAQPAAPNPESRRASGTGAPQAPPSASRIRPTAKTGANLAPNLGPNLARGIGAFLKPFGRVGGIVWLEVTGVFFFLPVLVFAPTLWRTRFSYAHGPDHRTFVASAIVIVIFFYLGVSSFWRARRK
jgi:hypothetical protein